MFEQQKSEELLDRITESIQELLTNDDKDIFRVRKLMNIFDDANAVKRGIRAGRATTKVELQQTLKEMEQAREEERKHLGQLQAKLNQNRQVVKNYKNKVSTTISNVLQSVYEMKRIESMVQTNLGREEINKQLKEKSNEVQKQYLDEEAKICKGYNNKTEDAVLKILVKDLEATVREKEEEVKRHEEMLERYTAEEKEMHSKYRQVLDMDNQRRRETLKFNKKYSLTSTNLRTNSNNDLQPVQRAPFQPQPVEVIIIPAPQDPSVKIQTIMTVVLTFLTLLIFTYAFTRQ